MVTSMSDGAAPRVPPYVHADLSAF
jgi:hypothetical protein